ncbi:hypothetical protein SDC9_177425 [bioreactor metagenome]|uniref:Uncharacterized protein n=1 Tax=bioreactor metagenome TaxID=1076179 RepID=A0A645GSZ4_9ZZZZ
MVGIGEIVAFVITVIGPGQQPVVRRLLYDLREMEDGIGRIFLKEAIIIDHRLRDRAAAPDHIPALFPKLARRDQVGRSEVDIRPVPGFA